MDQAGLLFLHLHDELDPAAVQNAFAILAAVQRHHIGHALRGNAGDAALGADQLDHLHGVVGRQGIGVGPQQLPQLIGEQRRTHIAVLHDDVGGKAGGGVDGGQL